MRGNSERGPLQTTAITCSQGTRYRLKTTRSREQPGYLQQIRFDTHYRKAPSLDMSGEALSIALPLPRLPADILDAVVEHVEDTNTLKILSLVSSQFLRPTRRILFHALTVGTHDIHATQRWIDHFEWKSCVHILRLRGSPTLDGSPSFGLLEDVLMRFPAVKELTLFDYEALDQYWSHSSPSIHLPSIKKLFMHSVHTKRFSGLAKVLATFPALFDLKVHHVEWRETDDGTPESQAFLRDAPRHPIQKLDVWSCWTKPLLNYLFPADTFVQLRQGEIDIYSEFCVPRWRPIVERAGRHLEHLTIHYRGYDDVDLLDLAVNTELKSISLDFALYDFVPDWILQTLASLRSRVIDRISLDLQETRMFGLSLDPLKFGQLDQLLSGAQFSSLKAVNIDFEFIDAREYEEPVNDEGRVADMKIAIVNRMPQLYGRGILTVEPVIYTLNDDSD
ncbi:hypothetical protein NM688_g9436 [Phlebia brevispora]|uniref:Uncharacterized protein n=1 Tax=Phlebia brevispora TaxID=194682 RepID=A0ACC1RIF1_9APHY|nr:hypothetical protein NM688_g9436 [Phlebia brevispora]